MNGSNPNALAIFSYHGASITFDRGDAVMVNATEMAKPFGKRVQHFLNTQQTNDIISAISQSRNLGFEKLVQVVQGGNNPGTWMHEDVALEFARWLSPSFAIWCNDRIKELLTQGVATISDDDEVIARAMGVLQRRLDDKTKQLQQAQAQIEEDRPKIVFANALQGSNSSCLIGECAKILRQNGVKMGERRFFEYLRANGYLCTKGERRNLPTQEAIERGLFEIKKGVRSGSGGVLHETKTSKITAKGQAYFINKFLAQ